ncbi:MAG: hypothetical protein DI533_10820 [Cereibacter sphaeroides]|uniref:Carbon monoxide dehydrogenase n=1 Tax=Cereibacter sphaeroides TaxID=1063 RepID=A0A2W5UIE0_CERSP|nr:MAG: hypothetical protein DI533_10820 [Cereibacter sphaeroides]
MKLQQEFTVARPLSEIWAFFQDVPAVATCLQGAEYLGTREDGKHSGKMSMKIGPFQASFEGEAEVNYNTATHTITMEGKGVDKKGASRGKMTMACNLAEVEGGTKVVVDADIQLSGTIAQFGRTGIIQEIANVMISDFVRNVEAQLPAPSATPAVIETVPESAVTGAVPLRQAAPVTPKPMSGTRLIYLSLKGWLRSLFSRAA